MTIKIMPYEHTQQISVDDLSNTNVETYYDQGYVFTRLGKGIMNHARSLRINLSSFSLTSENRRVLKKSEEVICFIESLPYEHYHWSIGKLASDFYSQKFGEGTMSANKIKEMFTEHERSNMNSVFVYRFQDEVVGYCLAHQTKNIVHYAYPFYNLPRVASHKLQVMGIAMMMKAIMWAKGEGKRYVYLGTVQSQKALYKLQFKGLEWLDHDHWNENLLQLKEIASSALATSSSE